MIYLKSFLAGVGALVLAVLILAVVFLGGPLLRLFMTDQSGIGGMVVGGVHLLSALGISLLAFAGGFYWQFRRSR
jgi:hypothetical protein